MLAKRRGSKTPSRVTTAEVQAAYKADRWQSDAVLLVT